MAVGLSYNCGNNLIAGSGHTFTGSNNVIGGGAVNIITGTTYSTISGGRCNTVSSTYGYGVIGGGFLNTSSGYYSSTIAGGSYNTASGGYSTIVGGSTNFATGNKSFVGGGSNNCACGSNSTISAGFCNRIVSNTNFSSIHGGFSNIISAATLTTISSVIGGGRCNIVNTGCSFIGGGDSNRINGIHGVIPGGNNNQIFGTYNFIGGGVQNTTSACYSIVVGGRLNVIDSGATCSSILGGYKNCANATDVFILGSNITGSTACTTYMNNAKILGGLTASTKSFVIKHPSKPNMILHHGVLEGPEHSVYVRGRLTSTNTIILPDYWVDLVYLDTITVNLTSIGRPQNVYVQSVDISKIVIGGDDIDVYYAVYAERKDIPRIEVEQLDDK